MSQPTDPTQELEAIAERPSLELRFRDANRDGVLTPDEFVGDDTDADKRAKLETFQRYDADGDGVLTDEELKAGRQSDRKA